MNEYIKRAYTRFGIGLAVVIAIGLIVYGVFFNGKSSELLYYARHVSPILRELVVKDMEVGNGKEVVLGSKVKVDYIGLLTNGNVFDTSSADYAKEFGIFEQSKAYSPFVFTVGAGQVIRGWDQGLLGMREGGVRRLSVPASLGYGSQAIGSIPGNSTLVFEIKLVSVE